MKNLFSLISLVSASYIFAQFNIHISSPKNFDEGEAFIYSLSGSRDILISKISGRSGNWNQKIEKPYIGMMKIYFPKYNSTINFISENKDVDVSFDFDKNKITSIKYLDDANKIMDTELDLIRKKESILPALLQIQDYYKRDSEFGQALAKESQRLSTPEKSDYRSGHPFVAYYLDNYTGFLQTSAIKKPMTKNEIINFLDKSNPMLESSGLLRPILLSYINDFGKENLEGNIADLLNVVKTETPRGQIILSELIDIFDAYGMDNLKNKYLGMASGLKCTITEHLANTVQNYKNVEIGATMPDYTFTQALNTTSKSIHSVKASKKVIVFWASTCSHCEAELPIILKNYSEIKIQNTEVIGLSFDSNKDDYLRKATLFPWINDSELRGWHSSYADTYNIHATPTYFILDANNKIIAKPDHVDDVLRELGIK